MLIYINYIQKHIHLGSGMKKYLNMQKMNRGNCYMKELSERSLTVLNDIVDILNSEEIDLLYGDVYKGSGNYTSCNIKYKTQFVYRTICHQAIFADKICFDKNIGEQIK